jgi:hypothetical protein
LKGVSEASSEGMALETASLFNMLTHTVIPCYDPQ